VPAGGNTLGRGEEETAEVIGAAEHGPQTATDSSFCGRPSVSWLNTSAASGAAVVLGVARDGAPGAAVRSLAIMAATPG
jgi:hypothetical protein